MQKRKLLERALIDELKARMSEYGFIWIRKDGAFRRKTATGWVGLQLCPSTGRSGELVVAPDARIRFDELENLQHAAAPEPGVDADHTQNYASLSKGLGYLYRETWMTWSIETSDQVDSVATELISAFVDGALPYFEKYSTPRKYFDVLVEDGEEARRVCVWGVGDARNVITLAYLFGEKELFLKLVDSRKSQLNEVNDPNRWFFLQLADALTKRFELDASS